MSTSAEVVQQDQKLDERLETWLNHRLDELLPKKIEEIESARTPSMAIVATKGTLDWAYPPFILASTGAALGWDVTIFFTFYGLALLRQDFEADVSPLGNPAMPMKMPFGPKWFKKINWNMPNLLMAGVPGFEKVATALMKKTIKNCGVASVTELRSLCIEAEVKMVACQMTVELFGFSHDEFIPDVVEYVGAASFLPSAQEADVSLFI